MKILVTGATGRIGRALLDAIPPGISAEALLGPLSPESGIPSYRTDITDRRKTLMAVTCAHPDAVIHLAAMTDVDVCERNPEAAFRVNRDGTANIAEACAACGAAMVYLSTDYVFNGRAGPYAETDAPNPVNIYGRSKREGETAAGDRVGRLAVVRVSVPFGARAPEAKHNFLSRIDERLAAGGEVLAATDQRTTPAWFGELAEFLWTVAGRDGRGAIHYGSSDRVSRYEMALGLCRARGYDDRLVIPVTTAELRPDAERPLESGFVTGMAASILGRPTIGFHDALGRMIAKEGKTA